ncbi:glucan endo-1,3-beta-glucosidase-like [Salvia splendens]|uniref:glucan endo-1,3-beta-glucosidase-like n=1 Tax=Salvia splendens TaxID=180675 RepID=UPI001C26E404|nr:glucan endo-1,3-beta-glucosidase-like [Salvia splendens]
MILFYLLILLAATTSAVVSQFQGQIGVCNGRVGNNLPPEQDVVELYKANGIKKMRIYDPNPATISALQGSDIELLLGVPNVDLPSLQSDATAWIQTNVIPHFPATKIRYIAVGNEIDPSNPGFAPLLLPAMQSIYNALSKFGLQSQIKVSTAAYSGILASTSPPSASVFKDASFMAPIVNFLVKTESPLLVNIYPYFAYLGDKNISLDFVLFNSERVEFVDNGMEYKNIFDAMVDGVYYALEKAGGGSMELVVSESGWPSGGGDGVVESVEKAAIYYRNLIGHVEGGTPKRKGKALETYLFGMFDENEKSGSATEQHFGLFNPIDKTPKYQLAPTQ